MTLHLLFLCPARRDRSVGCRRFMVMKCRSLFIVSQPVGPIEKLHATEQSSAFKQLE
jgi:hypothetical protein